MSEAKLGSKSVTQDKILLIISILWVVLQHIANTLLFIWLK